MQALNVQPIWHRCGTCGALCETLKELKLHMQTHTGKFFTPEELQAPLAHGFDQLSQTIQRVSSAENEEFGESGGHQVIMSRPSA